MRRNKLIKMKTQTNPVSDHVCPWDIAEQKSEHEIFAQIPTHRQEIVNKFLSQITTKKIKMRDGHTPSPSSNYGPKRKSVQSAYSPHTHSLRRNKTQNAIQDGLLEYQQYTEEINRRKKQTVNAKVVNLTLSLKTQNPSEYAPRGTPSEKLSLTRKLRFKEGLKVKKNISPTVSRKKELQTISNIFKSPCYLYEFGQSDLAKRPTVFLSSTLSAYRRRSSSCKTHSRL